MDTNEITKYVIGAAIAVHRALGPGLLESAYETCLEYELLSRGIPHERQKAIPLTYRGIAVESAYRVDFVVRGRRSGPVLPKQHRPFPSASYIPGAVSRSAPPVIENSPRRLHAQADSLLPGSSGRSSPIVSVVKRLALMPKPVR